ncbi:hypothetical protein [Leptolyngbya sp. BC1307]|uniref:hypothetical protein n=1 Tax=Leptolyngbya sp. BC1307 TaxID=2029589 RepID=UPI001140B19A|nr:hypothetical protein [Leptolyngbya sp. BC1307]
MMKLKRLVLLALTTCTVIVIGSGLAKANWLWVSPSSSLSTKAVIAQVSQPPQTSTAEETAITQATIADLVGDSENLAQMPDVIRTVVEGEYALATWVWGEAGGQTVLSQAGTSWTVLSSGGGAVDVSTLEELDIPTAVAEQLIESDQAAWEKEAEG